MRSEGFDGFEAGFERFFDDVYGYVAYRVAPDVEAAAIQQATADLLTNH